MVTKKKNTSYISAFRNRYLCGKILEFDYLEITARKNIRRLSKAQLSFFIFIKHSILQ